MLPTVQCEIALLKQGLLQQLLFPAERSASEPKTRTYRTWRYNSKSSHFGTLTLGTQIGWISAMPLMPRHRLSARNTAFIQRAVTFEGRRTESQTRRSRLRTR